MRHCVVLFAALILAAVPLSAFADELEERLEAGSAAFRAGEYDRALQEFEAAQRVSDLPVVRFNIARANEELSHCSLALSQYAALAASADADDDIRAAVAERITALEQCEEPTPIETAETSPPPVEEPSPPPNTTPPRDHTDEQVAVTAPSVRKTNVLAITGWTVASVGATALVATIIEHQVNRSRATEGYGRIADDYGCSYSPGTKTFIGSSCDADAVRADARYPSFDDQVRKANRRAAIFYPLSSAILATGIGLAVLGHARSGARTTAWFGREGAGVEIEVRF